MTYLEALESELTAAGIPARRRARIVMEFADHLHEDPNARLGAPGELARQFADELGTRIVRSAALRAFAVLAFAGIVLAVMFLGDGRARQFSFSAADRTPTPGWAAPILLLAVLAAQISLAAGGLALLRALRVRRRRVISWSDATILVRRTGVALLAGAVAMCSLPVLALAFPDAGGSTWHLLAWILTGIAFIGLALATPAVVRGMRLRPRVDGEAADLVDDLAGVIPASFTPLRVAALLSVAIFVVVALVGVRAGDPYDGMARGIADGAACIAGYAILGRYLGLRRAAGRGSAGPPTGVRSAAR
jgi:hypothetical protein